ncbi:DUF1836 domain-containing protein [Clostridium perfringens]|uniref:Domain of uncharacterized function (DUF1836) n=2 Tax=Clostridium perfringens TaxID=1502 RepID=A0A2X3C607_CLOPF|nr:DUF1836 domain-containing protein [Clostridium perfringens]ABG87618.1 conserved hypothetical protein [Clostridium perfringens SM101]EJT5916811.1 DUF1836 domain-containing protein [Clostridium perfringens]EJT5925530.1 DUF1836 domain-containing protein [Clostridium perfringens]EJT5939638.1 DUF1836 domain-containing protein [Clostridium perfringens]EJT6135482.1 DUF1836 domain-containing protein [Clostridium perfringens]
MDINNFNSEQIKFLAEEMSKNSMVSYDDLPKYDLFLSQVIDYLNDKFTEDKFTNNIVQNYIKSEVISKPEDGKKRGYTKVHLAQLVLLSYMRPLLKTDEIKKVFALAFNNINDRSDDIISWETAYKMFGEVQEESIKRFLEVPLVDNDKIEEIIQVSDIKEEDRDCIVTFLTVMTLIAQASVVKKVVQKIVNGYHKEEK